MKKIKSRKINETASSGSVGSASIAVNMSPLGGSNQPTRQDLRHTSYSHSNEIKRQKEEEFKKKEEEKHYKDMRDKLLRIKAKKKGFKNFLRRKFLGEGFDLYNSISKLRNAQRTAWGYEDDVVSYGVEDDNGNIMRITVPLKQAKDFEYVLARELEKYKENRLNGSYVSDRSLAEILFDLKNKFEIIDVKFPIIPTDVIYNADDAVNISELSDNRGDSPESENNDNTKDVYQKDKNPLPEEDEANLPNPNEEVPQENEENNKPEEPSDENENLATDFEETETDESGLLNNIIKMLTADAEAKRATREAEAEKARARQAEYTSLATQRSLENQEKMARIKADIDNMKKNEKKAKELADMAKYNVMKASNGNMQSESYVNKSRTLKAILSEMYGTDDVDWEDYLDTNKVQQMHKDLDEKYKVLPTDDPNTRSYKRQQLNLAKQELNARKDKAQSKAKYNDGAPASINGLAPDSRGVNVMTKFDQNMQPNNDGRQRPM